MAKSLSLGVVISEGLVDGPAYKAHLEKKFEALGIPIRKYSDTSSPLKSGIVAEYQALAQEHIQR